MTDEESKAWKEGYAAGMKQALHVESKAIQLGRAILDIMYETFECKKEDY